MSLILESVRNGNPTFGASSALFLINKSKPNLSSRRSHKLPDSLETQSLSLKDSCPIKTEESKLFKKGLRHQIFELVGGRILAPKGIDKGCEPVKFCVSRITLLLNHSGSPLFDPPLTRG
jgi:hypothetical protein